MEKRFKISSKNMGFIATGNDITSFILSTLIAYIGGKGNGHKAKIRQLTNRSSLGHRPKWMAFGIVTIVIYCLMNAAPHFIYGPGENALALTVEHGAIRDEEQTKAIQELNNKKLLCQRNGERESKLSLRSGFIDSKPVTESNGLACQKNDGNFVAQVYLFGAQLIAGVGQSLKHTLGISFLDDNIKKSKTPALISE
jgi:solute carrier organic anion transporter family, member 5A